MSDWTCNFVIDSQHYSETFGEQDEQLRYYITVKQKEVDLIYYQKVHEISLQWELGDNLKLKLTELIIHFNMWSRAKLCFTASVSCK